jgi:hypothetical protein
MTASARSRHSRRRIATSGFPQLAAELPPHFYEAANINGFIHSLTAEVIAGRLDRPTAAVLGYLSQLAIQTLPMLHLDEARNRPFQFITNVPRPDWSETRDDHSASLPDDTSRRADVLG